MHLTEHAKTRCQQRGIPPLIIQWLNRFGERQHTGNSYRIFFNKKSKKKLEKEMGKIVVDRLGDLMNLYIIKKKQNSFIVTAGHRTKRFHN